MQLGKFGVWQPSRLTTMAMAREIEEIGFPTLWIGGELPDLQHASELLAGTDKLIIGTSIVNIWQGDPTTAAEAYLRIAERSQAGSCWASVSAIASRTCPTPVPWRH